MRRSGAEPHLGDAGGHRQAQRAAYRRATARPSARYAEKGLPHAIREFARSRICGLDTYCSLEGQIAAVADDIAYNNHDIDDGFRAGYIAVKELEEVPMAGRAIAARPRALRRYSRLQRWSMR